jgi:MFS family permease
MAHPEPDWDQEMEQTHTNIPATDEYSPDNIPLLQAVRLYPKIVACAFGLALAFLLTGYDTVILGTITAVPYFKQEFGEFYNGSYIIPATWLSVWSAIGPVGSMVGAVNAGWFQDRIGRRWSLALSCVVCAAGIAIAFCSNLPSEMNSRRGAFLVGRTVQGWGVGGAMAGAQTYLSETVPTSLRGSAMALSPTFMLLGELLGAAVIYGCEKKVSAAAYLIPFGTQWITTILPFMLVCILPESPSYLIRKGKYDAAHRALAWFHTDRVDVSRLLAQMRLSITHEVQMSQELAYIDCLKGTNLRRTMIVAFSFVVPSFFGVPLLASASYFMQVVGMGSSLSLIVLILGIVLGLIANAIGVWLMSRVGRRRLMLSTLAVTTVIWLSMGIAGCWSGNIVIWYVFHPVILSSLTHVSKRYTAACMMAVVVVCGLGAWPASYAVSGETSSLRLRAKTQGIGVLCYMLSNVVFNLVLPYVYNTDAGDLKGKTGFVYAGLCLLTFVVTWLIIPEMKDRTTLEVDAMFESGLPCRDFEKWAPERLPLKDGTL